MRMPFNFIVSPRNNEQYINTVKIGDKELTVNTSIEHAANVQRIGVVVAVPLTYNGDIKVGDEVVVHHNIFRISYSGTGKIRESDFHIKDNLFQVEPDLIYMAIRDGKKVAVDNVVFVEPIIENDKWLGEVEKEHVGIVRYVNKTLQSEGVNPGDKIAFHFDAEYEFNIDGERLYMMKSNRVLAKLQD